MPWNGRQVLQLSVLLFCVPAQLLISWYYGNSGLERKVAFKTFFDELSYAKTWFLNWELWKYNWWLRLLAFPSRRFLGPTDGDSPAVEVLKYRSDKGYFATSPQPRSPRPNSVLFRVGQVVTHKTSGYRGVIAGWDPVARAPQDWLRLMYPKQSWSSIPNYVVLVDVRDRSPAQMTYVPQENLVAIENTRVIHPKIPNHFSSFDGAQYLPRQWLQTLYPED